MRRIAWPDAWQRADEEDKRLLLMVGVSLILHATVLWLWKAPTATGSMTISPLTVFLPERADSKPPVTAASVPSVDVTTPVLAATPEPVVVPSVLAPVAAAVPPKTPVPPSAPAVANVPNTTTPHDRSHRHADGVAVVLRVNTDGEVIQVFWDRLPAINNEQFNRLEAIVRTRRFGSHVTERSITEIIDVRALLDLPPAQAATPLSVEGVTTPP